MYFPWNQTEASAEENTVRWCYTDSVVVVLNTTWKVLCWQDVQVHSANKLNLHSLRFLLITNGGRGTRQQHWGLSEQEAQLLQRDRATRYVSNFVLLLQMSRFRWRQSQKVAGAPYTNKQIKKKQKHVFEVSLPPAGRTVIEFHQPND